MANWGQPDFNDVVSDEQKKALAVRCIRQGYHYHWPYNDQVRRGYNAAEIQQHCVRDAAWQNTRLSMKGKDTGEKLDILVAWWHKHYGLQKSASGVDVVEIQVGNYLGALRRGGQLDDSNHIRRWR